VGPEARDERSASRHVREYGAQRGKARGCWGRHRGGARREKPESADWERVPRPSAAWQAFQRLPFAIAMVVSTLLYLLLSTWALMTEPGNSSEEFPGSSVPQKAPGSPSKAPSVAAGGEGGSCRMHAGASHSGPPVSRASRGSAWGVGVTVNA